MLLQAKVGGGLLGGEAGGKALYYVNRYTITTNTTTYTFSSCDLGTPSDDRRVIVAAHMYGSTGRTLTSATINGVSATELTTDSINTANTVLIIANVPTGSTGDIVLTWSSGCAGSAVTVWYATGLTSDTPVDASRGSGSSPTSTSALTTVAGGFIAAAATCRYNSGTTRTHSWTNATEIFDLEFENTGTDGVSISAAYVNPTDGSSITLTDTLSVAGSVVVVAATF